MKNIGASYGQLGGLLGDWGGGDLLYFLDDVRGMRVE